jgi:hypothetical protein
MPEPYTSAWWLDRLSQRLDARSATIGLYEDYYLGHHRLSFATTKFRETFGNLFRALAVNFCLLVVDAENERLNIEGFNMGGDPAGGADTDAWRFWRLNKMEARAPVAHAEALSKGESYIVVWSNPKRQGVPLIRIADARRMIVEHDDGDDDARLAALRRWIGVDRYEYATLYLPDRIEKYRSREAVPIGMAPAERAEAYWVRREVSGEDWPIPNPLGVVPVIPLSYNPMLTGMGRSELASVVPIQDAINKLVADMIVASEYVAFPQRWATGIDVPTDPNTGVPLEPFKAGPGRLWIADAVPGMDQPIEPKFGSFPQANLSPYTDAIEMLVQDIASITKTPAHYLLGQSGNFPSGESLKATETGLVAKSRSAMRQFGESWEETIRLAFRIVGDSRGTVEEGGEAVIWRDPESRVLSEVTDAVGKHVQMLGVPHRIAWEKVGYSQTEIERMEAIIQQERIETATLAATIPVVAPAVPATNGNGTSGAAPTRFRPRENSAENVR